MHTESTGSTTSKDYNKTAAALFLWCIAIGFTILYVSLIFNNNIWTDEGFTMQLLKSGGLKEITEGTAADVHPPLYYYWAKLFMNLFGPSLQVQKIAAIIPMTLLLIYGAIVIRKHFGTLTAILFDLFIACIPCSMEFAVQVRMYSMAILFVTVCGMSAYLIFTDSCRSKAYKAFTTFLYIACGLGAAYTHYFALVTAFLIALVYLIACIISAVNARSLSKLKAWFICSAVMIIGYLPWVPSLIAQVTRVEDSYWIPPVTGEVIVNYFTWTFGLKDDFMGIDGAALGTATTIATLAILSASVLSTVTILIRSARHTAGKAAGTAAKLPAGKAAVTAAGSSESRSTAKSSPASSASTTAASSEKTIAGIFYSSSENRPGHYNKQICSSTFSLICALIPALTCLIGVIASILPGRNPVYRDQYIFPALGLLSLSFAIGTNAFVCGIHKQSPQSSIDEALKNKPGDRTDISFAGKTYLCLICCFLLGVGALQYRECYRQEYTSTYLDKTMRFFEENVSDNDPILYNFEAYGFIYEYYWPADRLCFFEDFDFSSDFGTAWILSTPNMPMPDDSTYLINGLGLEDMGRYGIEHNEFEIYKVTHLK